MTTRLLARPCVSSVAGVIARMSCCVPAAALTLAVQRGGSGTARVRDARVGVGPLDLHVRVRGQGPAPPVLLLHGLTGISWEWDPIAARLARGRRVVAADARGHGASDPAADYAPARMVEDVGGVVAALGLGRVALVGHSMGALIGLLFAAARPDAVERLVLVDAGPETLTPQACEAWSAWLREAHTRRYADAGEAFAEWRASNPRAREAEVRHYIAHSLVPADGGLRWRYDAAGLQGFLALPPSSGELWAALRDVACPMLILRGAHSDMLTAPVAQRMALQARDGTLAEIAGGAHDLTVEQPRALAAAIDAFVA